MKNKPLALEHANKMYYSEEIIQMTVPREIRLLFCCVILIVTAFIVLMCFCRINDVIKAGGSVRTKTNNSTVKNVISGKIEEIYYEPEQFVKQGDLLYSLNSELFSTKRVELNNQLKNCEEQLECIEELLKGIDGNLAEQRNFESEIFIGSQLNEYFGNLKYFEKQQEILEFKLKNEQNQPESFYNKRNIDEILLNLNLCILEKEKYKAEVLADIVKNKKAYELERDNIRQEIIRNEEQMAFLDVRAPVSGFVQEVSLLNKGDYVSAEQTVLVIVPDDSRNFRVEMSIPTKDIGEIVPGMTVKYRLSAFPFFEYRGAEGKILSIDSDVRQGSDGKLYYRVYSDIDRTLFTSKKGTVYPIKAGIEIDARIVKEKISVIHFILRKLDFMQ